MTQTISLYAVIFLILALLATGGAFALYRHNAKTTIAELTAANAAYQISIDLQKATITQMEADAAKLAQANRFLQERFAKSEADYTAEWSAIEALNMASDQDATETERIANETFERSIGDLKAITAKNTKPAE